MNSATTFKPFGTPICPPEIQDLIWQHAIDDYPARCIELQGGFPDTYVINGHIVDVRSYLVAKTPVPAALHTCSRSREIAKRRWSLIFASEYDIRTSIDFSPELENVPRTWFDFESDTLLFLEDWSVYDYSNVSLINFVRIVDHESKERVRNVALVLGELLSGSTWSVIKEESDIFARTLYGAFPSVGKFQIIDKQSTQNYQYFISDGLKGVEKTNDRDHEGLAVAYMSDLFERLREEDGLGAEVVELEFVAFAGYFEFDDED